MESAGPHQPGYSNACCAKPADAEQDFDMCLIKRKFVGAHFSQMYAL
jgi:hypothetical protein